MTPQTRSVEVKTKVYATVENGAFANLSGLGYTPAIDVSHLEGVTITVAGVWTAVVDVEVSTDAGATWAKHPVYQGQVAPFTGAIGFHCDQVRLACYDYTLGTITGTWAGTVAAGEATLCAHLQLKTLWVSGPFVATVVCQGGIDGVHWVTLIPSLLYPTNLEAGHSYLIPETMCYLRTLTTAYTSGTPIATLSGQE